MPNYFFYIFYIFTCPFLRILRNMWGNSEVEEESHAKLGKMHTF